MSNRTAMRGFLANVTQLPAADRALSIQSRIGQRQQGGHVRGSERRSLRELAGEGVHRRRPSHDQFRDQAARDGAGHQSAHSDRVGQRHLERAATLRSFMYPASDAWAAIGGDDDGMRLTPPPTCIFGFGTKVLECVVTDMTISETQFNSYLAPVRAEVRLTLVVIEDSDNDFYQVDKQHRNVLAALGLQSVISKMPDPLGTGIPLPPVPGSTDSL